jgi:hypothetical protein
MRAAAAGEAKPFLNVIPASRIINRPLRSSDSGSCMTFERIRNLRPVKRYRSEQFVLISLVAFALTVILLRLILKLTGYAQIGNDTVHIAHVLWGGLGLFAGALVLLVFANRWALFVGAVLCGGGMGFFIDEVGKFITQSNDYFTPAAAPIIYALFLATVLVYLRVRRPPAADVRGEMYRAFEQMSGVLDHQMSRHDLNTLAHRLDSIADSTKDPATRNLAHAMLAYVGGERPQIVEPQPGRMQCALQSVRTCGRRVFTQRRLRVFLVFVLVIAGVYSVLDMALLASLAVAPSSGATDFVRSIVSVGELAALGDKIWFSVRAVLEGSVGLALLGGGLLLALRKEWRGLTYAIGALIVDLTAVNLLVFYQDQWKALGGIAIDYILLGAAFSYRRVYLEGQAEEASTAEDAAELVLESALLQAAGEAGMMREVS